MPARIATPAATRVEHEHLAGPQAEPRADLARDRAADRPIAEHEHVAAGEAHAAAPEDLLQPLASRLADRLGDERGLDLLLRRGGRDVHERQFAAVLADRGVLPELLDPARGLLDDREAS